MWLDPVVPPVRAKGSLPVSIGKRSLYTASKRESGGRERSSSPARPAKVGPGGPGCVCRVLQRCIRAPNVTLSPLPSFCCCCCSPVPCMDVLAVQSSIVSLPACLHARASWRVASLGSSGKCTLLHTHLSTAPHFRQPSGPARRLSQLTPAPIHT